MNIKITENIEMIYNKCDMPYIDEIVNFFKNNFTNVMHFFNIAKLDKKVVIQLWDDSEKLREKLKAETGDEIPFWFTGRASCNKEDAYSRIDYLSLKEIIKIDYHSNETINDLKKGILHEFVHICHSQSCNYNYPEELFLSEGVATYLAHQYEDSKLTVPIERILDDTTYVEYGNYRFLFNILIDYYSKDQLLSILNNKSKLNYDGIIHHVNNLYQGENNKTIK